MKPHLLALSGIIVVVVAGLGLGFSNGSLSLSGFPQNLIAAVTGAEQADLTAGSISPTSATIGTPVTLSGVITNSGTKTTGSTFLVRFFIDNNADHASVPYTAPGSESVVLPGANFTSTATFTFPTTPVSNTWYVQLCADTNASKTKGIIPESNEDNNCGDWREVTIAGAPTSSITVTPTSGTAPFTVAISGKAVTDSTCAEGKFAVFFGDASTGYYFTVPKGSCPYSFSTSHEYAMTAPQGNNSVSLWTVDASGNPGIEVVRKDVKVMRPASAQPDLTASAVTPTSVIVNTEVQLSSVITNKGTSSTGTNFLNRFFIDDDTNHTGTIPYLAAGSESIMAAGGTFTSKGAHVFTAVGTWYVRLCADSDATQKGIIAESSETNNCGAWTEITVSPKPVSTISVTPTSGTAPLTVSISGTANTAQPCAEQGYVVFFGDGSGGDYFTVPKDVCSKTYTVAHTYAVGAPATNTPSLWRWHRDSAGTIVIDNELAQATDVVLQDVLTSPSLHTTPVNRPANVPKLSDRILSSRWERAGNDPAYTTIGAIDDFFSSRIDWNYSYQAAGTFIRNVISRGLGYSGAMAGQNANGPDALSTVYTTGRDLNVFGNLYTLPALFEYQIYMGDLSSPEYQRISLEYIRHLVTLGVRLIQFDDIGFQYNWVIDPIMYQDIGNRRVLGGYGTSSLEYFTKTWLPSHYEVFPTGTTGWGLPFTRTGVLGLSTTSAVTQFRDYAKAKSGNLPSTLQDTFYEFHKGQFVKYVDLLKNTAKDYAGGQKVSFSCNGGSYQWFGDEDPKEYIGLGGSPFPFTQCDFFNSELSFSTTTIYSSGEPEHIWSRNRYIEAHNKVQIFNPPYFPKHLYTTNNPGDPDEVKEIRKVIAFAYGIGSWMVAPWDMYVPRLDIYPNVLGSAFRYFGKDFEYADLYRFVKANAPYIDGYEHVYDTSSPAGGSGVVFNTPTVKGAVEVKDKNGVLVGDSRVHPVKITSLWRAYAFLRAKPNNSTAPSVIHLVNYSEMPPSGVARTPYYSEVKNIDIELTNSFFGWPSNVPMTLAVRMPGSYLASVGSGYSEQTLTGILYGGKTTFTVPVSKDYALLIIAPK